MIPSEAFQEKLRALDPGLFVRWEHYKPEPDGTVRVAPYRSNHDGAFKLPADKAPSGRFVVYHNDRTSRPYRVLEVASPDGGFHPLDNRVLWALKRRDDAWDDLDRQSEVVEAERKKAGREELMQAAGPLAEGLEIAYRSGTGLKQFAPGAPGAPQPPNSGHYSVVDRRRFR